MARRTTSTAAYEAVRPYRVLRAMPVVDFSGGWNCRAAPTEVADNESPDMLNVTLDEQGGLMKRLGYTVQGNPLPAVPDNIFYWPSAQKIVVHCVNGGVYLTSDFLTYGTVAAYSDGQRPAFGDFQGKLIAVHPTSGVSIYDGATWSNVRDTTPCPNGDLLAIWQNKVWVSGDPAEPSRVYASNAGHPELWTLSSDYNDMRDKDNAPVTALHVGHGMDIDGRPGLMVFKNNWWGRINDPKQGSTFGQYTTLHTEAGACGPESVASSATGQICAINERGIWQSDGVNPPQYASFKIEKLFHKDELNFSQCHKWTGCQFKDRVVFSVTRGVSQATNNFAIEYHPQIGWFAPHSMGFGTTAVYQKDDAFLLGGDPLTGRLFQVFKGWSDNGVTFPAHYTTRWFAPAQGYNCRMRRIRVDARGDFYLYTRGNYNDTDPGIENHFSNNDYGSVWGANNFQSFQDFHSQKVAKAVSWQIRENSQTPAFARKLLQDGSQQEVGSFALYGLLLDFVRLGYA